jgi:hypothetical protein
MAPKQHQPQYAKDAVQLAESPSNEEILLQVLQRCFPEQVDLTKSSMVTFTIHGLRTTIVLEPLRFPTAKRLTKS